MADNSSSTNSNSWTILSTEVKEPGVESVGPLSAGQGALQAEHAEPGAEQPEESETHSGQPHTAEPPQVAPLEGSDEAALLDDFHKKGDPADVETLTPQSLDSGQHGDSGGGSHESKACLESDLFSDSSTHLSASPEFASHPAASSEDAAEERRGPRKTPSEESKPDTDENRSDGDGLRRRKVHLLAPLEHRDEEEEEEEGEEERFRPPQRDGDISFSLNKCIFGALVLLGLGTIFFSGMFMDLDDEGDPELQPQKYPEIKKPPELLDQLAKESQQIANLQAQLQHQEAELKTAQQHVEEGAKDRLRREELELENQRMRGELNKLPELQKELEQENVRMKKELDGVPVLQKELELLRDKVTELTGTEASAQSGAPSAGREEEVAPSQDWKGIKEKKAWKKEGKKGESAESKKQGRVKVDEKESEKQGAKGKWETQSTDRGRSKQWRGDGEGKDVPEEKQDGGKKGKHYAKRGEEKREFKEGKGKKEWKEEKKGKKEQHEESGGGRREKKGKEDKQGKQKGRESDRKRGGHADQGDKRRKDQKADRKERGDWEGEKGDDKGRKEKTWKGDREREQKHGAGKENDGEGHNRWKKDEKKHKDKPKRHDQKQKKGDKVKSHDLYTDRKHRTTHMHGNYWTEQRERIRHFRGSTKGCADVSSCARAEGLVAVSRPDFEAFLSGYLKKLQRSEEQATRNEELNKLIGEFFTDGVFIHDQMPFGEFVEDVGDILEDMAEDRELEDEMDGFEREAMERFALQERLGTDNKARQSGRKRSSG